MVEGYGCWKEWVHRKAGEYSCRCSGPPREYIVRAPTARRRGSNDYVETFQLHVDSR